MGKLLFVVELELEDKITDDMEITDVAQNIATAIKRESEEYGITPDSTENFVKYIRVTDSFNSENRAIESL